MRVKQTALAFLLLLIFFGGVTAQQSSEEWHYFTPVPIPEKCQDRWGAAAKDDGTAGMDFIQDGTGLLVSSVRPGGPAEQAGVRKTYLLFGRDRSYVVPLDECQFRDQIRLSVGQTLSLWVLTEGSNVLKPISIVVRKLSEVSPVSGLSSPISQPSLGGKAYVTAEIFGIPGQTLRLRLGVLQGPESLLKIDEAKIFVLDKSGHQIQMIQFAQMKYEQERLIAEMQSSLSEAPPAYVSIPSPPPPPAPSRYRVTGTSDGTYTLTPLGGNSVEVSGQSVGEYVVEPEYDPGQQLAYGVASISNLIQQVRVARANARLGRETAAQRRWLLNTISEIKENLAWWEKEHFDTTRPIAPGEVREGTFVFRPTKLNDLSSTKAIVTLTDPSTGKDEFVTFQFVL